MSVCVWDIVYIYASTEYQNFKERKYRNNFKTPKTETSCNILISCFIGPLPPKNYKNYVCMNCNVQIDSYNFQLVDIGQRRFANIS